MTSDLRQQQYARYYQDPVLNLLFDLAPVSAPDIEKVFSDDQLFAIAAVARNPHFIEYLGNKYDCPPAIVNRIFDYDLRSWAVSMRKQNMLGKVLSPRERVLLRLDVWQKNQKALRRVLEYCQVPRNSYLDVGCLLGLTLANAAEAGFRRVIGVEILPHYKAFADEFASTVEREFDVTAQYIVGDICTDPRNGEVFDLITCVDVLEHTPDFAMTMQRLCSLCSADGEVYIYQGNGRSLFFAIMEPHYRLPFISIMEKDLSIRVLEHLGAVAPITPYVVEQWPTLEEIRSEAVKHGCEATLMNEEVNIRNDGKYPGKNRSEEFRQRYRRLLNQDLYPLLTAELKSEVETQVEEYEQTVLRDEKELDDAQFRRKYMMDSWNIVISKKKPTQSAVPA